MTRKRTKLPTVAGHDRLAVVYGQFDRYSDREVDVARALLLPLSNGSPVVLRVDDRRLPRRRRASVVRLFLTPLSYFGISGEGVVAGLETHGCEVFDPSSVTHMAFVRLGLSARLSSAIARELNILFKKEGVDHGTTQQ